ncbi:MAG: heme-binding protein [Burkholderiales bacterium]|nr:heme-binding protein [Burkholderiales bacterium]
MKLSRNLSTAVVATLAALTPAVAPATEEPRYSVVRGGDVFEVRRYEPYLVAEVVVPGPADEAGNQGFRILADYIFGANKSAVKMPMTAPVTQTPTPLRLDMTAPVTQSATADGFRVQFMMPSGFALATLPEPLNAQIVLREVTQRTYAVIRYSGSWSQDNDEKHLERLRNALAREGIATQGEPVLSRYNAPFVPPFLRRNEVWLSVL